MTFVRISISRRPSNSSKVIARDFFFSSHEAAIAALNNLSVAEVFPKSMIERILTQIPTELTEGSVSEDGMTISFIKNDNLEELQEFGQDIIADVDPLFHYVLMRTDIPDYSDPKASAQVNHAGTKMVIEGYRKKDKHLTAMLDEWEAEGGGFGTCIVLGVDAPTMRQAVSMAELLDLHTGIVHDPSYPVRDGDKMASLPVDTCAYLFGKKSACFPIVGKMPLLGVIKQNLGHYK